MESFDKDIREKTGGARTFAVDAQLVEQVQGYAQERMQSLEIAHKVQMRISVVIDEVASNVMLYSEAKTLIFKLDYREGCLRLLFGDDGKMFNPLLQEEPDVTLNAEERVVGGLGVYMVKKLMSDVQYEYKDAYNWLMIEV